uniref:Uncharacterized protein n=1 Tax=Anguilla anguilla TaxID=7936 RepID=A0A0E9V7I4_ANGAN
MHAMDRAECLV